MSVHVNYSNDALHFEDKPESRGHVCIPGALLHAGNLNNDCKVLWLILQHYAQQKNECWPSMDTLRVEMQCSENTIRVAMQKLATAGLVTVKHRGRGLSNVYSLPDIRNAKPEVQETQELKSRGSKTAVVDVPEPQKTIHEEVIREESTTEERLLLSPEAKSQLQIVCERLGIKSNLNAEELIEHGMAMLPGTNHLARAIRCVENYDDWPKKKAGERASKYWTFCENESKRAGQTSSNGRSHVKVVDHDAKDRISPSMQAKYNAKAAADLAAIQARRAGGPSAAAQ